MWTRDTKLKRLAELEAELDKGTAQLNRLAGAIFILKEDLAAPDQPPPEPVEEAKD